MDIFENVEREIGPYTIWLSYILKYLLCEQLNNTNRMVLCAFFYGNGLSSHRTSEWISSCIPHFNNSSDTPAIQNWFKLWNKSKAARSKRTYYNLMLNEVRDLNGRKTKVLLKTKVPLILQTGFDGLNEECIHSITNVFHCWLDP